MWKFIKQCFAEYNKCQEELNHAGIFFIPTWHGMIFSVYDLDQNEHKKDSLV